MIYKTYKKLIPFKGDYAPLNICKGNIKTAGWNFAEAFGESLSVQDTYNDSAGIMINGNSQQVNTLQNKNLFDQSKHNLVRAYNSPAINVPVNLSPQTYRFSCNLVSMQNITYSSAGALLLLRVTYQDDTTGFVQIATDSSGLERVSTGFTTTQRIKSLAFYSAARWTGGTITLSECQLEQGSTATPYAPFVPDSPSPDYPSPINSVRNFNLIGSDGALQNQIINFPHTLRSLPDGTKDYIDIDNIAKTAKLNRNIGELIITGAENWLYWLTSNGHAKFYSDFSLTTNTGLRCSHFHDAGTFEEIFSASQNGVGIHPISGRLYFSIRADITPDLSSFKNRLAAQYGAGTPVTVHYKLVTPTQTSLGYNEVKTYYPHTYIHTDATILPMLEGKFRVIG